MANFTLTAQGVEFSRVTMVPDFAGHHTPHPKRTHVWISLRQGQAISQNLHELVLKPGLLEGLSRFLQRAMDFACGYAQLSEAIKRLLQFLNTKGFASGL